MSQTSYRTRRSRDPWFDRPFDRLTVLSKVEGLTTLSEVEGVSSKSIVFSRFRISACGGFRNDGLGGYTQNIEFFISVLLLLSDVLEGFFQNRPQKNPVLINGVFLS